MRDSISCASASSSSRSRMPVQALSTSFVSSMRSKQACISSTDENGDEFSTYGIEGERMGVDSVWSAEAWGHDGATPLAYLAAKTSRIKLGSGILQTVGRTPANLAMTAMTLQSMSGGRFLLGLGVSGPQVVEGWHGVR